MQYRDIILIAKTTEQAAFSVAGVAQYRQSFVSMSSDDNLIVTGFGAIWLLDHDAGLKATDTAHWMCGSYLPATSFYCRREPLNVSVRAMIDGEPLRPVHVLQQAVIDAKSDETSGRKSKHGFDRTGPYCGGHRQKMIVKETVSIAFTFQKIAEREVMVVFFLKQARGGRKKNRAISASIR